MTTGDGKQISNPFSTGGGGVTFETQVQASFAALMLAGGFAPCLPCRPIQKLLLQGRVSGYRTDDLIIVTSHPDGSEVRQLLVQIKHSISLTEGNATFRDVVRDAWLDFQNTRCFTRGRDAFALVTGPLSATDTEDSRTLLEWARHSDSAEECFTKVETANFSSKGKRQKLKAFRVHVDAAAGSAVPDDALFHFLRHFHLIGYDLDLRSGFMHALLHSLIGRHAPANAPGVWAQVVQEMAYANQSAGTITRSSFSDELRKAFAQPAPEVMPAALASTLPPAKARAWDSPEFGPALGVANLLGGWNENSNADMALVADLTQGDPVAWLQTIREVLQLPGAPLSQQGGVWSVTKRGELWQSVGPRVFDEHLKTLQACAPTALAERDPQFDYEPGDRFAAAIYGSVPVHSSNLRRGLAETLALLGSQPEPLRNCSPGAAADTAAVIVRAVLEHDDWELWASVNDLLPLLAEASPKELMDAAERALSSDQCPFDELFSQEGSGIPGSNHLTGLQWALETLAWDEQFLVRATVLLGALAARDPGGQWANRPADSLATIFLPWLPQTLASPTKRQVAVQALLREQPEVGWRLLLGLMPDQTSMSTGTRKPRWRSILPEEELPRPSHKEYWEQVIAYAEMAISVASAELEMLQQLVQCLDKLPEPVATKALGLIALDTVTSLPDDKRFTLWASLSAVARKHRRFADAEWALPKEQIVAIEAAAEIIAPKQPAILHRVLFTGDDWDLQEDNDNWEEQEKQLQARRREAVAEVHVADGVPGVIEFARNVGSPSQVGYSLAMLDVPHATQDVLPRLLREGSLEERQFAEGFVRGNFRRGQWAWVDTLDATSWSLDDIAQLLMYLPFGYETWRRAERVLGEEASRYWRQVCVNPYQAEDDLDIAVDELLKHGRPRAAVNCVARLVRDKKSFDRKQAVDAVLASVSSDEPINSLHSHHLIRVIQALQDDPATPDDDLFAVEWAYLPILNKYNRATPRALELRLASDPGFFSELIRMVYRSNKDSSTDAEPNEEQKARAKNAYRLLHEWKTMPGMNAEGEFSGGAFVEWMNAVRSSAEKSGHLEVALHEAGSVLTQSPADSDGLCLDRCVAEVLNRGDMAQLRHGYRLAIYDSRGAHFVDPTGEPEKRLASKYDQQAEDIENAGYHRLAATLREVAEAYRREAEQLIAQSSSEQSEENKQ